MTFVETVEQYNRYKYLVSYCEKEIQIIPDGDEKDLLNFALSELDTRIKIIENWHR